MGQSESRIIYIYQVTNISEKILAIILFYLSTNFCFRFWRTSEQMCFGKCLTFSYKTTISLHNLTSLTQLYELFCKFTLFFFQWLWRILKIFLYIPVNRFLSFHLSILSYIFFFQKVYFSSITTRKIIFLKKKWFIYVIICHVWGIANVDFVGLYLLFFKRPYRFKRFVS